MPGGSSSPAIGTWPIVPIAAGALAIAIFVVDTLTHVNVAVGVLYVAVVLIALPVTHVNIAVGVLYVAVVLISSAPSNRAWFCSWPLAAWHWQS